MQLLIGFLCAALIAFLAYRTRSLSKSGALGALLEGTIIFGLGGWQWAVLLLTFFISSSVLTRLFGKKKTSLNEKFDKGGVRDIGQVLANGGIASLFAGLHFFFPAATWTWAAFAASLAAVNADTWATELFDSYLGATVQAIYRCPQCDKETEKHPLHTCGTQTVQVRGWKWLNNDMVNLACAAVGALIGMIV